MDLDIDVAIEDDVHVIGSGSLLEYNLAGAEHFDLVGVFEQL